MNGEPISKSQPAAKPTMRIDFMLTFGGKFRDGNPQTSTTARKICHPDRVAGDLQKSWIWSRPPDGSWVTNRKGYRPRAATGGDSGGVRCVTRE